MTLTHKCPRHHVRPINSGPCQKCRKLYKQIRYWEQRVYILREELNGAEVYKESVYKLWETYFDPWFAASERLKQLRAAYENPKDDGEND